MSYVSLQSNILVALVKTRRDLENGRYADLGISALYYTFGDRLDIKSRELSVFKHYQIKNLIGLLASSDIWDKFHNLSYHMDFLPIDDLEPNKTYMPDEASSDDPQYFTEQVLFFDDNRSFKTKIALLKSIFLVYGYGNRFHPDSKTPQFYSSYCDTCKDLRLILRTCDLYIDKIINQKRAVHKKLLHLQHGKKLPLKLVQKPVIASLRFIKRRIRDIEKLLIVKLQTWVNSYPNNPEIINIDKSELFDSEFFFIDLDEKVKDGYLSIWALCELTGLKRKSFLNEQRNNNLLKEDPENEKIEKEDSKDLENNNRYYEFNSANIWLDSKKIDCKFHGQVAERHETEFKEILDSYNALVYDSSEIAGPYEGLNLSVLTTHRAKQKLNLIRTNNQELFKMKKNIFYKRYKEFFKKYPKEASFAAGSLSSGSKSSEIKFLEALSLYLKMLWFNDPEAYNPAKHKVQEIKKDITILDKEIIALNKLLGGTSEDKYA